ncbi:lanthionine synthetase C family protein [Actinoplanes sp. NPDC051861]|uniref:lanthionine synthetase C family protein n=1 Tax=Actinoplanes sp. NPDC051861 TaxID=3155170 RepID=UPI003439D245
MIAPPVADPFTGWRQSLYDGAAGMALLPIEQARTGGDAAAAAAWAATLLADPISAHPDTANMSYGAPAVAFALHCTAHGDFEPALQELDRHIIAVTQQRIHRAHARIDSGQPPRMSEYDLIRGLTGIGAYLLHRGHTHPLREVLRYLARLTEPLPSSPGQPGWWTSDAPSGRPDPQWPGGHANIGIAHGITGPLALLALAALRGITVPASSEAITRILLWLDQWQQSAGATAWWPELVTVADARFGSTHQDGPGRPSWCYGTPGITRAIQLAGLALNDSNRTRSAELALFGCVTDDKQLAALDNGTLCHGWAGLVHTTRRVADDARDPDMFPVQRLRQLQGQRSQPISGDDLLLGSTGIDLVHHANTYWPPVSSWDSCLLLA